MEKVQFLHQRKPSTRGEIACKSQLCHISRTRALQLPPRSRSRHFTGLNQGRQVNTNPHHGTTKQIYFFLVQLVSWVIRCIRLRVASTRLLSREAKIRDLFWAKLRGNFWWQKRLAPVDIWLFRNREISILCWNFGDRTVPLDLNHLEAQIEKTWQHKLCKNKWRNC